MHGAPRLAVALLLAPLACNPAPSPQTPTEWSPSDGPVPVVAVDAATAAEPPPPQTAKPGQFVQMSPVTTAGWQPDGEPLAQLDRWLEQAYGRFPVLERAGERVRIAVDRRGVEVWLWVDLEAADLVLRRATALCAAPGRPPTAQLAAGLAIEERARRPDAVRIGATLFVLSSEIELEGWVAPGAVGRLFRPGTPPPVDGDDHALDAPMRSRIPLLDAPGGEAFGAIRQGIAQLSVAPIGPAKEGLRPVAFSVENERGAPVARIEAFLPATQIVPPEEPTGGDPDEAVAAIVSDAPVAEPAAARPESFEDDLPAGTCLFDAPNGRLVGRSSMPLSPGRVQGAHRAVHPGGLELWAGPSVPGGCPSRL